MCQRILVGLGCAVEGSGIATGPTGGACRRDVSHVPCSTFFVFDCLYMDMPQSFPPKSNVIPKQLLRHLYALTSHNSIDVSQEMCHDLAIR